jgi:D-galactarolactone cycloisomerase
MKVSHIEPIPLKYTPDLGAGERMGSAREDHASRSTLLVRVELSNGTVGWGEASTPTATTEALVNELLLDQVVGMDPFNVDSLVERASTRHYHVARSGLLEGAIAGIDLAIWDALGRSLGQPVFELIGGANRTTVTPYASTMYLAYGWEQDPATPIRAAAEEGFNAAKIKIGRSIESDVERVSTTRDILGEDAYLMVDYNGNYRPDQVKRSMAELEPYDIFWVEEPVPPENTSGYRELKRELDVPLAAGEAHNGRSEFKRFVDERLVDIVQPNVTKCGGFSEARFLAKLATTENVATIPHVWNSGVGLAASLQFAATVPAYPHVLNVPDPFLFEFDRSDNRLRTDLLETPIDPEGGEVTIPDGPGLGVTVDEDAVDTYRMD